MTYVDDDYSYEHLLFYDHLGKAEQALDYVKVHLDAAAELSPLDTPGGHPYVISFTTEQEFEEDYAQKLMRLLSPVEYDLNWEPGEDGFVYSDEDWEE